jgi:tRNA (cmo5U34)-methyltransferase
MTANDREPIEEMRAFFDARSDEYDAHMLGYVFTEEEFNRFYGAVAAPISETSAPIQILDLGCGTGLELAFVFERAPNAQVTGLDLSEKMLALLRDRYSDREEQIRLAAVSFLTHPLGREKYDFIISVMSAHHLPHPEKLKLYRKIWDALKPGGRYIEGDSVTLPAMEPQFLAAYEAAIAAMPPAEAGSYHIDLPFSIETQKKLLREAGFVDFELIWQKDSAEVWNAAVYVCSA